MSADRVPQSFSPQSFAPGKLTQAGLARADEILRAGADGVALLRTVMAVECRGSGFDRAGRILILYEPHIAYRLSDDPERARLVARGLAYAKWGTRPYPKDSYPALTAAAQISREIACKSCSWGLGQILGANHKAAGYASAVAMASAFASGEDEQAAAMTRFIVANPAMHRALLAHDWAGFAARYNGPGYVRNAYHTRLAAAYARFRRDPWAGFTSAGAGQTQADVARATAIAVQSGTQTGQDRTSTPGPQAPSIWPALMLGLVFVLIAGVLVFRAIESRPSERAPQEG